MLQRAIDRVARERKAVWKYICSVTVCEQTAGRYYAYLEMYALRKTVRRESSADVSAR